MEEYGGGRMEKPFYMINGNGGSSVVRHPTFESAMIECKRLCMLDPSKKIDILRSMCEVQLEPVFREESYGAD